MTSVSPRNPPAVNVVGLFQPDRDALLTLLSTLAADEWDRPTVCASWDVHDIALHLLGGDLSKIARLRDGHDVGTPRTGETLPQFLNRWNEQWIEATRRLSPKLTTELLASSGRVLFPALEALPPHTLGERVSWAGPTPAPNWLDVAREYMERWIHQQQIRDAVRRPGQRESRFAAPVIAASMRALPIALATVRRQVGATLCVAVTGDAGGTWTAMRDADAWTLFVGQPEQCDATLRIHCEDWWRIVTLGITPDEAAARSEVSGDPELARAGLGAVAIIA